MKPSSKKTPPSAKKPQTGKAAKGTTSPKLSRTHKPEDMTLEEWQLGLRRQFGEQQEFVLENTGGHPIFSEFSLSNPQSGKTYRIAIRGLAPGSNFCSCPDYQSILWEAASTSSSSWRGLPRNAEPRRRCARDTSRPIPRCT